MELSAKLIKNATQGGLTLVGSNRRSSLLLGINRDFRARMTGNGTAVCIEGFPRSANTFAFEVFRRANPSEHLAHHLHVPSQVLAAAAMGIPCAVLVRRPLDALLSMLVVDPNLSPAVAARSWLSFYRRSWRVRERVVVCLFDEVIEDPGIVAERLNARFGTAFARHPPLTPQEREELLRSIESKHFHRGLDDRLLTVPSKQKERLKEAVEERVRGHRLLPEADRLFQQWAALAVTHRDAVATT